MELPRGSGSMYQHGQGVPEDLEKAVEHYKSGADLGIYTHRKLSSLSLKSSFLFLLR